MKVTVCFGTIKVVVPCGQGNILIRDLATMAVMRYQKSVSQSRTHEETDPMASRAVARAHLESVESRGSKGPSRLQLNDGSTCVVNSLTLARDGGILDWDDRVIDVLDDRELLIAHYYIKPSPSNTSLSDHSSPLSASTCNVAAITRCNGEDRSSSQEISRSCSLPPHTPLPESIHLGSRNHPSAPSPPPCSESSPCIQFTSVPTSSVPPPPPPLRISKRIPLEVDEIAVSQANLATLRGLSSSFQTDRPAPPPPPPSSLASSSGLLPLSRLMTNDGNETMPDKRCDKTSNYSGLTDESLQTGLCDSAHRDSLICATSTQCPSKISSSIAIDTVHSANFSGCSSSIPSQACYMPGNAFDLELRSHKTVPIMQTNHSQCCHDWPLDSISTSCCSQAQPALSSPQFVGTINSPVPPYPPLRLMQNLNSSSLDSSTLSTVPEEDDLGVGSPNHGTSPLLQRTFVFEDQNKKASSLSNTSSSTQSQSEQQQTSESHPCEHCSEAKKSQISELPTETHLNYHSLTRPNRKIKRRRVPRAPAPPPPLSSMRSTSPTQSFSSSSSGSPQQETDTSNICLRTTTVAPPNKTDPQERVEDHSSRVSVATTTGPNLSFSGLSTTVDRRQRLSFELDAPTPNIKAEDTKAPSLPTLHTTGVRNPTYRSSADTQCPIPTRWSSTTDCIPGYTPQELAEAEKSFNAQHQRGGGSTEEPERKLSMDEERAFAMRPPAPPKRSPLTMLTGLSPLTPSNQLCGFDGYSRTDGDERFRPGHRLLEAESLNFPQWTKGNRTHSCDDVPRSECASFRSSDHDEVAPDVSSLGEENDGSHRLTEAAEDEVLHMTELLSKRRESEARRHLMMAELEADIERDHRLQAAANALALAAATNLSPRKSGRLKQPVRQQVSTQCPKHGSHSVEVVVRPGCSRHDEEEQDLLIPVTKTPSGFGFSLTARPIRRYSGDSSPSSSPVGVNLRESTAVCVKSILPGGSALKGGQLCLGDRLIEIDGQDVTDKTQTQVVHLLRVKPVGSVVRLRIRRRFSPPTGSTTVSRQWSSGLSQCPACITHKRSEGSPVKACPEGCPYRLYTGDLFTVHHPYEFQPAGPDSSHRLPTQFYHTLSTAKVHSMSIPNNRLPEKPTYRCASPTLPPRASNWNEEFPELVRTADYPPYPDVFILQLDISLSFSTVSKDERRHAVEGREGEEACTSTSTSTANNVSRHMRLGVSVRETCSSRASKIAERGAEADWDKLNSLPLGRVDEYWSGADSIYGGVLVKGIIEGGAAHKDGRLRVGDELLEVNGVLLINKPNPLAVLRSVLRRTTSPNKNDLPIPSDRNITNVTTQSPMTKSHPVVRLLVARQMRHRRSASGHTLASNSELWTEASSISTVMTSATNQPSHPAYLAMDAMSDHSTHLARCEVPTSQHDMPISNHSLRIAAEVHSQRPSGAEEEPVVGSSVKETNPEAVTTTVTVQETAKLQLGPTSVASVPTSSPGNGSAVKSVYSKPY